MAAAPAQPKKPAGGAFGRFMAEKRAEFAQQCKGKPVSAVSKLGGEEWKKLTEAERAPFQKLFEEARTKYDIDMAAFLAAGGVKQKGTAALRSEKRKLKEGKKAKTAKDPNAPSKPVGGAFGRFMEEKRAEFTEHCKGKPASAVSKLGGEEWKKLTESDRAPYQKLFEEAKTKYDTDMAAFLAARKEEGEEEEEEDEDGEEGEESSESPAKKARVAKEKTSPKDKKPPKEEKSPKATGKGCGKTKVPEPEPLNIPKTVLARAGRAGMVEVLNKLLQRDDIKKAAVSADKALDSLRENKGLLHPARRALLGA